MCARADDGQNRCIDPSLGPDGGGGVGGGTATIWKPGLGLSWQLQERGILNLTVEADVFVIGLLRNTEQNIGALHQLNRRVICTFTAGVGEITQSDVIALPPTVVGNAVTGESGLYWLNVRSTEVRSMVAARMDIAAARGCDGVSLTWVDGFQDSTGFGLVELDLVNFLKAMAVQAHDRNLSIGLDNAVELSDAVAGDLDFSVNQGCLLYNECSRLQGFGQYNKPVFHYELRPSPLSSVMDLGTVCAATSSFDFFTTIIKTSNLDGARLKCR